MFLIEYNEQILNNGTQNLEDIIKLNIEIICAMSKILTEGSNITWFKKLPRPILLFVSFLVLTDEIIFKFSGKIRLFANLEMCLCMTREE